MFKNPRIYYDKIVSPAVNRFFKDPSAYDLCFSACIFLDHFCDVLAEHLSDHDSKKIVSKEMVRSDIESQNPLFSVVHAVSVAAKHVEVKNKKFGVFVGMKAEHADVGRGTAFSDGSYFSDGSSFAEHGFTVRITSPDGRLHDLTYTVTSVNDTIRALSERVS